jgi:hypothetical protein
MKEKNMFKRVSIGVVIFLFLVPVFVGIYVLKRELFEFPVGNCVSAGFFGMPMPFDVSKAGTTITCEVEVKEEDWYAVEFVYLYDELNTSNSIVSNEINRTTKNKQGAFIDIGSPLLFDVSVVQNLNAKKVQLIDQKNIKPQPSSRGKNDITKELVRKKLQPGLYTIIVKNNENEKKINFVTTKIAFGYASKAK